MSCHRVLSLACALSLCAVCLISGPNTPIEIRRAGQNAKRNSPKLQNLMKQWVSCEGIWSQNPHSTCRFVRRTAKKAFPQIIVWLTRAQIIMTFGSAAIADAIIAAKLNDEHAREHQVRRHLDLDGTAAETEAACTLNC